VNDARYAFRSALQRPQSTQKKNEARSGLRRLVEGF
jgi:hypothetical protein